MARRRRRRRHRLGQTVIDTPLGIECARMAALKNMMHLESVGLRRRGPSAFSIVKREYKLRGNRKQVGAAFTDLIERTCLPHLRPHPLA